MNGLLTDRYVKGNSLPYGDNTMNERYIVCTNQLTEPSESFIDSSRRLAKMSEGTFIAYPNLDGRFMNFGKVLCGMRIQIEGLFQCQYFASFEYSIFAHGST